MATWWIIPARKDSKELPGKNRTLVPLLLKGMPAAWRERSILTTDDEALLSAHMLDVGMTVRRPPILGTDTASMRAVLRNVVQWVGLAPTTMLVVLYPTFPKLDHRGIMKGIEAVQSGAPIVLGRMPVLEHPYRMFVSGDPLTHAGVYRRQDYPTAWSICHAVCVMRAHTLDVVDDNLWHPGVEWVDIPRQLDVDTQRNMEALKGDS